MGSRGLAALERVWKTSSAPDYIAFGILLGAYILMQAFVEPFHRLFALDNQNIQYPHALVERVPVSWLFIYAMGGPIAAILIWAALWRPGTQKTQITLIGLLISLILTAFITDVIKNAVGRPRPDLIARCKPKDGTPEHSLVGVDVCTEQDHHVLHDGWRSFPSGHSSFAFSGLGYLAMFICGQLRVFRPGSDLFGGLLALVPMLAAALIAISRCEDYRHDVYDVTIGSTLGFIIAWLSYRRYYPRLSSPRCEVPLKREDYAFEKLGRDPDDEEEAIGMSFIRRETNS